MKHPKSFLLFLFPVALVSCNYNAGLSSPPESNPLDPPRPRVQKAQTDPYVKSFKAGTFKQTTSPISAFYTSFPRAMEQPTKNLPNQTDVKIISTKGSYAKVEVVNTGEIGFIPSVMLGEKASSNEEEVSNDNHESNNKTNNRRLTPPTKAPELVIPDIEPLGMSNPHLPAE